MIKHQQGVAIITALLIVTLATTISITISTQLQLDIRRTGNMIANDQAHIYSLLTEEYLQIILQDKDSRDAFTEELITAGIAQRLIPIDNATIEVEATDLSGCININSLVDTAGNIDTVTDARLTQLFSNKGITANLTQAIADWIDDNLDTRIPNGAEDGYYMNLEKPYRSARSPMVSINELRLIKGFEDDEVYSNVTELVRGTYDKDSERFSGPVLCAFNTSKTTAININTASVEVLKSIQPSITTAQLDDILKKRTDSALTSVPAVFTTPANLATESSYYLLKTKVIIGNANKVTYSIIYWDGTNTFTLSRTQRTL
jgi:general secretion pathway protein K